MAVALARWDSPGECGTETASGLQSKTKLETNPDQSELSAYVSFGNKLLVIIF